MTHGDEPITPSAPEQKCECCEQPVAEAGEHFDQVNGTGFNCKRPSAPEQGVKPAGSCDGCWHPDVDHYRGVNECTRPLCQCPSFVAPAEQRESAMTHAYRMRPLYKGKPEGGWAYHKLAVEIADMIEDADEGRVYEVERVAMTQGEFEALPDFEGW